MGGPSNDDMILVIEEVLWKKEEESFSFSVAASLVVWWFKFNGHIHKKRKDPEIVSDFNMLWEPDETESALLANKYLSFCLIKY